MTLNVSRSIAAVLPPTLLPMSPPAPTLVLFGRDQGGKPHASVFEPEDAPAAERAAVLMGFRTFVVTDEQQMLIAGLTAGKIFSSGKAFVPFIKADVYSRLLDVAGLPDTPSPIKAAGKPAEPLRPQRAATGAAELPEALMGLPSRPPTGPISRSAALCWRPVMATMTATMPLRSLRQRRIKISSFDGLIIQPS